MQCSRDRRWTTSPRRRWLAHIALKGSPRVWRIQRRTLPLGAGATTFAHLQDGLHSQPLAQPLSSGAQYYHARDVKHRLKEQEELRRRSGPEAPGSRRAAGEAARLHGLGEAPGDGQASGRQEVAVLHANCSCSSYTS
jgi:hypothetical protein